MVLANATAASTTPPTGATYSYDRTAPFAQRASTNGPPLAVRSGVASGAGLARQLEPGGSSKFLAAEAGIVAEDGTKISGITGHGIDRVIGDGAKRAGVKPQALLDAITNPTKITEGVDDLGRPFKVYTGRDARVVVNPNTGRIASVNPRSGAGANR
jgi:hypothetical protein